MLNARLFTAAGPTLSTVSGFFKPDISGPKLIGLEGLFAIGLTGFPRHAINLY